MEIERLKKTYHAVVKPACRCQSAMLLLQERRAGILQVSPQRSCGHQYSGNGHRTGDQERQRSGIRDCDSDVELRAASRHDQGDQSSGLADAFDQERCGLCSSRPVAPVSQPKYDYHVGAVGHDLSADAAGFLHPAQLHVQGRRSGTDQFQEDRDC